MAGACPCELALSVTTIAAKWSKTYPAVRPSQGPCHGSRQKCWKPFDRDREPSGHDSWYIGTNAATTSFYYGYVALIPSDVSLYNVCLNVRFRSIICCCKVPGPTCPVVSVSRVTCLHINHRVLFVPCWCHTRGKLSAVLIRSPHSHSLIGLTPNMDSVTTKWATVTDFYCCRWKYMVLPYLWV